MAFDEKLAARIRGILRRRDDITERNMFGGLAFMRCGKMCCGVIERDLVTRVVDEDMAAALERAHTRPMDFTGKPLRGFVFVGPRGLRTDPALREWIARGVAFADRAGDGATKAQRLKATDGAMAARPALTTASTKPAKRRKS